IPDGVVGRVSVGPTRHSSQKRGTGVTRQRSPESPEGAKSAAGRFLGSYMLAWKNCGGPPPPGVLQEPVAAPLKQRLIFVVSVPTMLTRRCELTRLLFEKMNAITRFRLPFMAMSIEKSLISTRRWLSGKQSLLQKAAPVPSLKAVRPPSSLIWRVLQMAAPR